MDVFVKYDLVFLVLFTLAVVIFLYTRKHNLKREGLLYLYRTKLGIDFIEKFTKKYSRILKPMQYLVLVSGFILMILMIWFLIKFSLFYILSESAAEELKVPVVVPLIPYLPELFNLDFLPPFYFTYWIIIIAIIAIPHEFAHGIFARLNKIKIHSTGFGFLGPFLAAFVEPDEKQTAKSTKFAQMSVLAAGTFANVLTTIVALILLGIFFLLFFNPAGINFNSYSMSFLNSSDIEHLNGLPLSEVSLDSMGSDFINISSNGKTYFTTKEVLLESFSKNNSVLVVYDDAPAFNAKLSGAIVSLNGVSIKSYSQLSETLSSYSPGDLVTIETINQKTLAKNVSQIILGEREGKAFLGVGIAIPESRGISGLFFKLFSEFKEPSVFYQSSIGPFGQFIYDLLWWTVIICISVALVNMLPVGIFDGGRFFYLSVWALTKKEHIGKMAFKISTWIFIALIVLMMLRWFFIFL